MKAISLWQPWASAAALESKRFETRGWAWDHRGPVAIHAAKHWTRETEELLRKSYWRGALWELTEQGLWMRPAKKVLPLGCVVCVADLVEVMPVEEVHADVLRLRLFPQVEEAIGNAFWWCEFQMGDYSPGRYAWRLENVRRLKQPIPFKGRQGPFDVPDELIEPGLRQS